MSEETYLTPRQARAHLGVTAKKLQEYSEKGTLEPVSVVPELGGPAEPLYKLEDVQRLHQLRHFINPN